MRVVSGEPLSPKRSERKLTEVARHVVVPTGIVDTLWFRVEEQCREWGDEFDLWQDGLGQVALGLREDGTFAATIGGVTLSIPRQVAKTFIVSRIVFALAILFPNLTILWTAHRTRTATQTFEKMKGLARKPEVRQYMAAGGGIRSANGEQEFNFRNGSKIMFGAREQGFGRGFDEVDVEVFDEAQILTEKALEDMVAATNQSRFIFGALLFFMGTPPRPNDPGIEFENRRKDALASKPSAAVYAEVGDSAYIECSADPNVGKKGGPSLDDMKQVEIANPSYPDRTPKTSILRLRKNLTSDDSWRREGLGVWDERSQLASTISLDSWGLLAIDPDERPAGNLVVGVKFSVDGSLAGLSVAVKPDDPDAPAHVDSLRAASTGEGYGWIADWCEQRKDKIAQIVIDGKGSDSVLIELLIDRGFKTLAKANKPEFRFVRVPSLDEYLIAHETFLQAVVNEEITHGNGELLNAQIGGSMKRAIGNKGGWGWQPITDSGNTVLIDSATLAFWGATTCKRKTMVAGSGATVL